MSVSPFLYLSRVPKPQPTYDPLFFNSVLYPALPFIETRENKPARATHGGGVVVSDFYGLLSATEVARHDRLPV